MNDNSYIIVRSSYSTLYYTGFDWSSDRSRANVYSGYEIYAVYLSVKFSYPDAVLVEL